MADSIEDRLSLLEEKMDLLIKGLGKLADELERGEKIQPGLRVRMHFNRLSKATAAPGEAG